MAIEEDWLISLSVIYGLGAVASLWLALLSPMILDYWDKPRGLKKKGERDWATVFIIFLIFQPFTFTGCAIGIWWINVLAYIPPAHLVCTVLSFLAIDFFNDDNSNTYRVLWWRNVICVVTVWKHIHETYYDLSSDLTSRNIKHFKFYLVYTQSLKLLFALFNVWLDVQCGLFSIWDNVRSVTTRFGCSCLRSLHFSKLDKAVYEQRYENG